MAQDNNGKLDNPKSVEEVIYPEIEPGIISKEMIEKSYLEEGYKGEEARLHRSEAVVYDRITSLRLDFQNILRIDHLWILPNLTKLALNCNRIEVIEHIDMLVNLRELDLSFNYIERIENLEKLVNLEVLSLFSNLITKIENLDTLEKLVILSIGNNLINTTDGIERFRFLPNLKVLNIEGNPITHESDFSLSEYVIAILPNIKYYEYVAIKDDQRENAKARFYDRHFRLEVPQLKCGQTKIDEKLYFNWINQMVLQIEATVMTAANLSLVGPNVPLVMYYTFSRELREIETNQEMELQARALKVKEMQTAEHLKLSFVEHLNEHQLFESLWKEDEDGRMLLTVGEATVDLAEEYDNDMFELTQEIYKLGLKKYEERLLEVEQFQSSLKKGHLEVQQMGQAIVEEFIQYKDNIFEEAMACHKFIEGRAIRGEDEETEESIQYADRFDHITVQFDDMVNNVWQQLMSQELHLHEATEEITVDFQRNMQEMLAKFVEQAQTYFSQLRDIVAHFSENLNEIVSRFIATKLAMQDFNGVPEPLRICMEDRDAIVNIVAGMKDTHTRVIDEREDRLMRRSKEFVESMIDELTKDELERNRAKVLEINTFLDLITDNFQSIQQEVRDALLNEEN